MIVIIQFTATGKESGAGYGNQVMRIMEWEKRCLFLTPPPGNMAIQVDWGWPMGIFVLWKWEITSIYCL